MRLKNGLEIHYSARVTEYGGSKAYAFWQEDMFSPRIFFVRGDSFEDAYENFLAVLPEEEMTYPNLDHDQVAEYNLAATPLPDGTYSGEYGPGMGKLEGFTYRDGGGIVYSELVQGCNILGSTD